MGEILLDSIKPSAATAMPEVIFKHSSDYVQSLDRGLAVICAFDGEHPSMTLSEVAERAQLSRAVARRLLLTLEHLGYVLQDGRKFSLTPRVLNLGFSYLGSLNVANLALPFMEDLAHNVSESCSLAVLEDYDIVYVQRVTVRKVMTIGLTVGARLPAFCASLGRVLVAGLDEESMQRWLRGLKPKARTPFTVTDKAVIEKELQRVRAQGYSYVQQEIEEGLCSIAVPIRDGSGSAIASLNVGMPYRSGARGHAVKEVLPALQIAAERIERVLPRTQSRRR